MERSMKIKDLLESSGIAEINPGAQETMPPTFTALGMDQYYEYYRFLVAIAGLPDTGNIPINGPIEDGPYIAPYSKIEHDHSVDVLKKMGKDIRYITKKPSQEMSSNNVVSPVRRFVDPDGIK